MKRKFRVAYEEQVELDLISAVSYYNDQQKGLGARFFKEYLGQLNHIKRNPFEFQFRYDEIHAAPLKVFPFLIFYIVEDDLIIILSVIHSSQNPENWPKKPQA